nr:putative callose synthase 6 [Tanacetum cinerariifolium]
MDSRSTRCGVYQFKTYMLHRLEKEDVEAKHQLAKSDPREIQKYYLNFYEKIIKEEMMKYYQIAMVLHEVLKTVVPPSKVEAEINMLSHQKITSQKSPEGLHESNNDEKMEIYKLRCLWNDNDFTGDDDGDGDNEIESFNDDGIDMK